MDCALDGQEVTLLVDTGATRSYISFAAFRMLFPDRNFEKEKDKTAIGFDGSEVQILGKINSQLQIGGYKADLTMLIVPDMHYEGILGADFLEIHTRAVKLDRKSINLKDKSYEKLRVNNKKSTRVRSLILAETVIIQPRSQ